MTQVTFPLPVVFPEGWGYREGKSEWCIFCERGPDWEAVEIRRYLWGTDGDKGSRSKIEDEWRRRGVNLGARISERLNQ